MARSAAGAGLLLATVAQVAKRQPQQLAFFSPAHKVPRISEIIGIAEHHVWKPMMQEADWMRRAHIIVKRDDLKRVLVIQDELEWRSHPRFKNIECSRLEMMKQHDNDIAEFHLDQPSIEQLMKFLSEQLSAAFTNYSPPALKDLARGEPLFAARPPEADEKERYYIESIPDPSDSSSSDDDDEDEKKNNGITSIKETTGKIIHGPKKWFDKANKIVHKVGGKAKN